MICVCNLPANEHDDGCKEQTPGKEILNEEQGCVHHEVSPVENPTVDAASVFHDEGLEGAPYHNTNQVREIEKHRKQNQLFGGNDL